MVESLSLDLVTVWQLVSGVFCCRWHPGECGWPVLL